MLTEHSRADRKVVNNAYYDSLGEGWHAGNEPVALLRAEGLLKNAWVLDTLRAQGRDGLEVLDIGCGGGFLSNELARAGHCVTGVDLSEPSLVQARSQDHTKSVKYLRADAYRLPFADRSFDAVACFDFLEHVSRPNLVIAEAARVLRPDGLFFYHTFSRNPLSHLIVIKGLEWFVRGTPEKLHVPELFIKPSELDNMLRAVGLTRMQERGLRPRLGWSFWKMLVTGRVDRNFSFAWTSNRWLSYAGFARK